MPLRALLRQRHLQHQHRHVARLIRRGRGESVGKSLALEQLQKRALSLVAKQRHNHIQTLRFILGELRRQHPVHLQLSAASARLDRVDLAVLLRRANGDVPRSVGVGGRRDVVVRDSREVLPCPLLQAIQRVDAQKDKTHDVPRVPALEKRQRLISRVATLLFLLIPQRAPVSDAELVERVLGVARVLEHVEDAPEIALQVA
mmetsp:Transcript_5257/g.16898  ORF Transcript_5257/g.16898 Transcript_5257/m.16898 type:complete len:202 (+) Transcript_5257:1941-2546(+)